MTALGDLTDKINVCHGSCRPDSCWCALIEKATWDAIAKMRVTVVLAELHLPPEPKERLIICFAFFFAEIFV